MARQLHIFLSQVASIIDAVSQIDQVLKHLLQQCSLKVDQLCLRDYPRMSHCKTILAEKVFFFGSVRVCVCVSTP